MGRYQPALLGGLFIGVLSSLPGLNIANCCCLWVLSGGLLTTYLLQQNDPKPLETSTAAIGGLIAGAIGGLITALINVLLSNTEAQREMMDQMFSQMGDVPPEMVEMIETFTTGPAAAIIGVGVTVPLFAVFGLLGGLLGLAFFRKKPGPTEAA